MTVDLSRYRHLDPERIAEILAARARALEERHFELALELQEIRPGPNELQHAFQARKAAMEANLAAIEEELDRQNARLEAARAAAQRARNPEESPGASQG